MSNNLSFASFRQRPVSEISWPFFECRNNYDHPHEFEFSNDYFARCRFCRGVIFLDDLEEYTERFNDYAANGFKHPCQR